MVYFCLIAIGNWQQETPYAARSTQQAVSSTQRGRSYKVSLTAWDINFSVFYLRTQHEHRTYA